MGTTEATETTETSASGRKIATEDLLVETHNDGTGGKYRVGGIGSEESADKIADYSG